MKNALGKKLFIVCGRMQIPHIGHSQLITECLNQAKEFQSEAKLLQVDTKHDIHNPHNSRQIKQMIGYLFPEEIESSILQVVPLSTLGTGSIQHKETWDAIANGRDFSVIFGKKKSKTDMVGDGQTHYMEYVSKEFGFEAIAVEPVIRRDTPSGNISATAILQNPYAPYVSKVVSPKVRKYVAALWQSAYDEDCKVHEVDDVMVNAAYQRFENHFRNTGEVLTLNMESEPVRTPLALLRESDQGISR